MAAVVVIALVMDAIRKIVSVVIGALVWTSALPNAL